MKVTKKNPISGVENTLDLDITQEQFDRWQSGELIQNAMPNLSLEEREFLISGLLPGEFDQLFSPDEEEEPNQLSKEQLLERREYLFEEQEKLLLKHGGNLRQKSEYPDYKAISDEIINITQTLNSLPDEQDQKT
jgi:hypothetical protein